MISYTYRLTNPRTFAIQYCDIETSNRVIVRPEYLSICHADQRYYLGKRDAKTLKKKLPMCLIHEGCGRVLKDSSGEFQAGQKVVMIPNVPGDKCEGIYENYANGAKFLSSGYDGFMREFVDLPKDRVVKFEKIPGKIAAITEFLSVAVHAFNRFNNSAHRYRKKIGIWGDGSLSYVLSCVLASLSRDIEIFVIGKDPTKLANFSFVKGTFLTHMIPKDFYMDHAFECAGGEGSYFAINDIIKYIRPQGSVILMGVSENEIPINTRDILEKGISLIGSSRSGREDFEKAIKILSNSEMQERIKTIVFEDGAVSSIEDMHRVFANDLNFPYKTVFKWNV